MKKPAPLNAIHRSIPLSKSEIDALRVYFSFHLRSLPYNLYFASKIRPTTGPALEKLAA